MITLQGRLRSVALLAFAALPLFSQTVWAQFDGAYFGVTAGGSSSNTTTNHSITKPNLGGSPVTQLGMMRPRSITTPVRWPKS